LVGLATNAIDVPSHTPSRDTGRNLTENAPKIAKTRRF
jgi:hypothetical protein